MPAQDHRDGGPWGRDAGSTVACSREAQTCLPRSSSCKSQPCGHLTVTTVGLRETVQPPSTPEIRTWVWLRVEARASPTGTSGLGHFPAAASAPQRHLAGAWMCFLRSPQLRSILRPQVFLSTLDEPLPRTSPTPSSAGPLLSLSAVEAPTRSSWAGLRCRHAPHSLYCRQPPAVHAVIIPL